MQFPDHPFWDYALSVYRQEGVSAACLELQERHGIDVNMMLFCLWIGHSGQGALSESEVLTVMAASDKWHRKVVKGLRFVRRILKDGFEEIPDGLRDQLRAEVQAVEINAEHLEQLMLADTVTREVALEDAPLASRAADAADSFACYFKAIGGKGTPPDMVAFAHILGKGFAGLGPDEALDLAEKLI
jgi:uncharacterized protein (TIGR02444 family)